MPILNSSSILVLSLRVMLMMFTVLSAAILFKFITDFPAIMEVTYIYNGVVSWLKPPYLYIVINSIIITIIVFSKLQPNREDEVRVLHHPVAAEPVLQNVEAHDLAAAYEYNDVDLDDTASRYVEEKAEKKSPFDAARGNESTPVNLSDDFSSNKENEISMWKSSVKKDSEEYSFSAEKPPASARFGHRSDDKASPEGGKAVLGVSKSKKQDTVETTWKNITDSRARPLTRHLKKSDTWERGGNHQLEAITTPKKMTKAGTFNDRTNNTSPLLRSASPGSGVSSVKLRREPSLSPDEVNRRVEAFIKKFNDEMRLQRQESFNKYREMINRAAR